MAAKPAPFASVPGIVPGIWGLLVAIGVLIALITQSVVIDAAKLHVPHALATALGAIAVGVIGARVWYRVIHVHDGERGGWCIQGFIAGVIAAVPFLVALTSGSLGGFFDSATPGLLFAIAIGRIGCLLAGCCGGCATRGRFAVWSSNARIGTRRRPTQLAEAAVAVVLGGAALAALVTHGAHHGTIFAATVAAYTVARQPLLGMRELGRRYRLGSVAVAAASLAVLTAAIAAGMLFVS